MILRVKRSGGSDYVPWSEDGLFRFTGAGSWTNEKREVAAMNSNMSDGRRTSVPPWSPDEIPEILTYVYPGPEDLENRYQLQWDYQIEWPSVGRPTIRLLRYRSFQRKASGETATLVEELSEDIPVNQLIMMNISKHAAGYLYAYAGLEGNWKFADRALFAGLAEVAKKRFSLASYRKMKQVDPNPRMNQPLRALLIRRPWIDMILDGQKTWEIRGSRTSVRETIGLVASGSGTIIGVCDLVNCNGPLTPDEFRRNAKRARMRPSEATLGYYRQTYAWVVKNPRRLDKPVPYKHPPGAIIWVKLDSAVERKVRSQLGLMQ